MPPITVNLAVFSLTENTHNVNLIVAQIERKTYLVTAHKRSSNVYRCKLWQLDSKPRVVDDEVNTID